MPVQLEVQLVEGSMPKIFNVLIGEEHLGKVVDFEAYDKCWRAYRLEATDFNGSPETYLGTFSSRKDACLALYKKYKSDLPADDISLN